MNEFITKKTAQNKATQDFNTLLTGHQGRSSIH